MKFWLKIGVLALATYLTCNMSELWQDRSDRRVVLREVEAVTRVSFKEVQTGGCSPETVARLTLAQHRLAVADARWERHASNLLLLASQ